MNDPGYGTGGTRSDTHSVNASAIKKSTGVGVNKSARLPIVAAMLCIMSRTVPTAIGDEPPDHDLDQAVTLYFKEADEAKRAGLVSRIESAAAGSVDAVAAAVGRVRLWDPIGERQETLPVVAGDGCHAELRVTLPEDYDPDTRYPLILALTGGDGGGDAFDARWLDGMASRFVVARVGDFSGIVFNGPRDRAGDPRRWLHTLRRRYHIDSDRVYLYGSGVGGDAAFLATLLHADLFAGAVIREGMLDVPFPRELQRILLPNLGDIPLHLVWTRPDLPPETALTGRAVKVALANQATLRVGQSDGLPLTGTVLSPSMAPDPSVWAAVFEHRRPTAVKSVSIWFRYPEQGHARFLGQFGFGGQVWEGDQLDILTQPGVDRSAFVTEVLRSKLARLTGRIDGQTMEIESSHCDGVVMLLEHGAMDWSRSIDIRYNGKRRFSGRLNPRIGALLESAYEQWEFQHPAGVRLRVGKRGRVLPF